ncbi:MAG: hypothetical protein V4692_03600, partial [Bdellovibrionota bacterium]
MLISSASHAQDLDEEAQAPETSPEQSSPTNPEAIPGEPVPDEKAVTLPDPKIVPEAVPLTSPSSAAEMSPPTSTAEQEDFNSPDATPTPVPNSKALEESGLSNPSGTGEYRRPLLFAPEDNGLKLTSPQIRWSMLRGTRINMGGLRVDANDIEVVMGSSLSFRWPEILSRIGTVSIETADGKRLWQKAVATEARREWNQVLKSAQADEISPHSKSLWGMIDIDPKIESFLGNGTQYRVCLSRKNSRLQRLKICSESFTAKKIGQAWKMRPVKSDLEANVYYMGKPISQSGLLNFPAKKEILLKIVFNNGSFFEIASQPMSLKLLDVVESKDGREVILTGSGEMPLGRKKIINQPETHFWSATGLDQEVIWQIAIPQEAPTVRVLGAFNVPFTYL